MKSFLMIGQSNMACRGDFGEVPEINNKKRHMLRMGRWQRMSEPVNPDRCIWGEYHSGVGLAAAKLMGAEAPSFTAISTPIFVYICAASITGYTLFYFVQRKIKLSTLSIIKFSEPLLACVFGAVLLGEDILKLRYLAAFVLITASILLARRDTNIGKKGEAYGNESKHS